MSERAASLVQRDRAIVVAAAACLTVVSWLLLTLGHHDAAGEAAWLRPWCPGAGPWPLAAAWSMWLIMMIAMMPAADHAMDPAVRLDRATIDRRTTLRSNDRLRRWLLRGVGGLLCRGHGRPGCAPAAGAGAVRRVASRRRPGRRRSDCRRVVPAVGPQGRVPVPLSKPARGSSCRAGRTVQSGHCAWARPTVSIVSAAAGR